jgi:hypothetical protein
MTQDYKDLLLKYLSGNLQQGYISSPPILNRGGNKPNTIYSQLNQEFEYGWSRSGSIQCKDLQGNLNNIIAWYGFYYADEDKQTFKGFIAILDTDLNLLQVITEYNTGTEFGKFLKLNVDTDGKIYGIDVVDNRPRFIMLNNISVKSQLTNTYNVILRQSYYLQGNVANITSGNEKSIILDKNPNGANYMIGNTDPTTLIEHLTLFTINVGASNEWTNYSITVYGGSDLDLHHLAGYYVKWQENKPIFYAYDSFQGNYNDPVEFTFYLFVLTNGNINTTTLTMNYYIDLKEDMFTDIQGTNGLSENFATSVVCLNENDYYYARGIYTDENGQFNIYPRVLHYNNGNKEIIYAPDDLSTKVSDSGEYELKLVNNTPILVYSYVANRYEDGENYIFVSDLMLVMFNNADMYGEALIGTYRWGMTDQHYTVITNEFNLYKINTVMQEYVDGNIIEYIYSIYNPLNYAGYPYENATSLVPRQAFLYDSNNNIIFARNLYNKVITNNTTQSTLEVPNTMLNDITIAKEKLMGRTGYTLVENQDTLEKNIYETLYINFFITMMIQNRNNPLYVNNLTGAIKLNNSVNLGLNLNPDVIYSETKITKIRINYNDSTSVVKNIESSIINNRVATITFKLFTIKPVSSIEIISNDETTTYQTISGSTLEQYKLYTITQECYVD